MSKAIDDALQLIESRLAEIDAEAGQLERALAGMGEGSERRSGRPRRPSRATDAVTSPPSKQRRRAPSTRKAAKRAARGQRRDELLAAIKATPGARSADLANSIGIKPTQVHALIAKARADKLIVKRAKGYALKG